MSDECNCWRKVYEHRADGTRVSGSLTDLANAIRYGADVQVRYFFSGPGDLRGEWHRTCFSTTFVEPRGGGGTPIVSCMVTDIPDTQVDFPTGRIFAKPFAFEWQAYNTSGERHVVKFDHQSREVVSETIDRRQIAWYVRGARGRPDLDIAVRDTVSETLREWGVTVSGFDQGSEE
jgi:hypothetical protein